MAAEKILLPLEADDQYGGAAARQRSPRALTAQERARWLAALEADRRAVRRDLPGLTRWMLATGLRIGEALAVTRSDVDLAAGTVEVDWKLLRITREGLRRVRRLKAGRRRLLLGDVTRLPEDLRDHPWTKRACQRGPSRLSSGTPSRP